MRAILAFELRLLRGGVPLAVLGLITLAILAACLWIGDAVGGAGRAAMSLAPLVFLFLLWREREAQRRLDALVGSIPVGPVELLASHLLFWGLVAFVPALALGLLAYGGHGAGPPPPFTLFTLRIWLSCWWICVVGLFTNGPAPGWANAFARVFTVFAVVLTVALLDLAPAVATALIAVLVATYVVWRIGAQASIEYLPALTPKRVRMGETETPSRRGAVPWHRRRDREGVRQARAQQARSPRGTLFHILRPIVLLSVFGLWVGALFTGKARAAGSIAGANPIVLLGFLHLYLHVALPRWHFLRQTPIAGRRVLLWFLVPLLLVLLPGALLWREPALTGSPTQFMGDPPPANWIRSRPGLIVPRGMREAGEEATTLPAELPRTWEDPLLLRYWRQPRIHDEAAYFEQVVGFFLRTRYHVDPEPGELCDLLGAPQTAERIASLALWERGIDARGELCVAGEIPLDIWDHLLEETGPSLRRARGDHLPGTETPGDSSDRLAFEARVAEVLAEVKQDGAVYDFGAGLLRVWTAFEGRIQEAQGRRVALDLVAFLVLLLASLRWGLRDPVSSWLALLTAAGLILAWTRLAWWPIGTTVYVWSVAHFGLVMTCGVALVAVLLVAFVRSLRTLEAPAVESL